MSSAGGRASAERGSASTVRFTVHDDQAGTTDRPPARQVQRSVRNTPVQARAAARIEALLDAAAQVIEEGGYETLTTAMIAERAGASIGTVYRYFPDRIAALVALGSRNLERLSDRFERTMATEFDDYLSLLLALFDDFVAAYREIPSFRSLRTGDMLDLGPTKQEPSILSVVEAAADALTQRFDIARNDENYAALFRGFTVVDALVLVAFQFNHEGDASILELAKRHGIQEIVPHFGDPQAA